MGVILMHNVYEYKSPICFSVNIYARLFKPKIKAILVTQGNVDIPCTPYGRGRSSNPFHFALIDVVRHFAIHIGLIANTFHADKALHLSFDNRRDVEMEVTSTLGGLYQQCQIMLKDFLGHHPSPVHSSKSFNRRITW
jgi:hypothetical protein